MRRRNALGNLTLAVMLAGTVSGCAAFEEVRRCGWNGCPPDARITAEIETRFDPHTELKAPNQVYVQTLNGVVYLTGIVATGVQRDTAEELVRGVPGVRRVVNNIALGYRNY